MTVRQFPSNLTAMVPTTAPETIEQYALRIEVGYGMEGALNDVTANRITREVIAPRLREGDFYGVINAGVDRMLRIIDGLRRRILGRTVGSVAAGGAVGAVAWLLVGAVSIAVLAGILAFIFTLADGGPSGRW